MAVRDSLMRFGPAALMLLLGLGVYVSYQKSAGVRGDIVITGRTPKDSPVLPRVPNLTPGQVDQIPTVSAVPPIRPAPTEIVIHVAGAVRKPDLYHLPQGSRAADAVKKAGGALPAANLDAINLAGILEDGKQLYVPTKIEQPQGGAPPESSSPGPKSVAAVKGKAPKGGGSKPDKLSKPGQGSININTATEEQLQRLPGVGPSYAVRIVQFRKDNGLFTTPDQLMDVSGIGPKKFEKMRPFVRIK